jgi:hypothetical protein
MPSLTGHYGYKKKKKRIKVKQVKATPKSSQPSYAAARVTGKAKVKSKMLPLETYKGRDATASRVQREAEAGARKRMQYKKDPVQGLFKKVAAVREGVKSSPFGKALGSVAKVTGEVERRSGGLYPFAGGVARFVARSEDGLIVGRGRSIQEALGSGKSKVLGGEKAVRVEEMQRDYPYRHIKNHPVGKPAIKAAKGSTLAPNAAELTAGKTLYQVSPSGKTSIWASSPQEAKAAAIRQGVEPLLPTARRIPEGLQAGAIKSPLGRRGPSTSGRRRDGTWIDVKGPPPGTSERVTMKHFRSGDKVWLDERWRTLTTPHARSHPRHRRWNLEDGGVFQGGGATKSHKFTGPK